MSVRPITDTLRHIGGGVFIEGAARNVGGQVGIGLKGVIGGGFGVHREMMRAHHHNRGGRLNRWPHHAAFPVAPARCSIPNRSRGSSGSASRSSC